MRNQNNRPGQKRFMNAVWQPDLNVSECDNVTFNHHSILNVIDTIVIPFLESQTDLLLKQYLALTFHLASFH